MPKFPFLFYCCACGHPNELKPDVPLAPNIKPLDIECPNCGDKTHVILSACPKCKNTFQFFLSDLDFPEEMKRLAETYVKLIAGIKESLSDHIAEFSVPVPKRWTHLLECECGHQYNVEIPLPQLD
jgi:hypothetical protein